MLSNDLYAMSWKFAEFAESGVQMDPDMAADFSRRFRAMAGDAKALECSTLRPEATVVTADHPNVIDFTARRHQPAGPRNDGPGRAA